MNTKIILNCSRHVDFLCVLHRNNSSVRVATRAPESTRACADGLPRLHVRWVRIPVHHADHADCGQYHRQHLRGTQ